MTASYREKPNRRGSVLILTIFFLIVLNLLAVAVIKLVPTELHSALREGIATRGSYAADAGIVAASKWLADGNPPAGLVGQSGSLGNEWSWQITKVEPLASGTFRITSDGVLRGQARRRVVAVLEMTNALLDYAFYFEGLQGGGSGNPNTAWPLDVPISGDVYFNGVWKMDSSSHNFNGSPTNAPLQGVVYATQAESGSPKGDKYLGGGAPYAGNPATVNESQYESVYRDGSNGIVSNYPVQNLDDVDAVFTEIKNDVLGATLPSGTITIPDNGSNATGGIFVDSGVTDFKLVITAPDGNPLVTDTTPRPRLGYRSTPALAPLSAETRPSN